MQRETALNLIAATFNQPFDESRFVYFASNLLNDISTTRALPSRHGAYIPQPFQGHIRQYKRPFVYYDPSGDRLDVLIVRLSKAQSLERARTMQRNFAAWYLKQEHSEPVEAALIAFYHDDMPDWRFSFVRLEYNFGDEGLEEKLTPVRRYSFLVGPQEPTHTAEQQLLPFLQQDDRNPTIDQLAAAFQVQTVSKQFFEAYKELFLRLVEETAAIVAADPQLQADFQRAEIELPNFAKKLLGQIVFLYFVQKKGWLGVAPGAAWGSGPRDFLRRLFAKADGVTYDNFFNDVLEPLFYRALAIQRPDDLFTIGGSHSKIPFLNGGLFEPMGNYDWENTRLLLPNSLFSNRRDERDEMGSGILDIFDRYNFTVWEEEPLEKEVAVDPEMLGKVFENLLEVQDRKSKGAFYTPREIVHYMCQESLINYLDTSVNLVESDLGGAQPVQAALFSDPQPQQKRLKTLVRVENVPREEIAALVRQGALAVQQDAAKEAGLKKRGDYVLPESVRTHARQLDEALARIRLCDPAIGSGAFPVGMLHEIVQARLALATYLGPTDPTGSGKAARSPYDLKRHAIQESIYGVDIDAGAVEIAKLRLWLSLVVDEENYEEIQPLPNLDYKIVQGNSLLGYPYEPSGLEEVERLKQHYFDATDQGTKEKLRRQINEKIAAFFQNTPKSLGYQVTMDFQVNFSEVFRQKGGFDVVIGNPPYVRMELFKDLKPALQATYLEVFTGRADLYVYFYAKGIRILAHGGTLAYITSNKFMRSAYGKSLRRFLSQETSICALIDFGDLPVFDATAYPCIVILRRQPPTDQTAISALTVDTLDTLYRLPHDIETIAWKLPQSTSFREKEWSLVNPDVFALVKKLRQTGEALYEYVNGKLYYGIKTGYNEAFVIDEETRQKLILADTRSKDVIKPWLRGRDVDRWVVNHSDLYVLFMPHGIAIKNYPAIEDHLRQLGKLEARATSHLHPWYEMQQPQMGCYTEYAKRKIIYPDIAKEPTFAYDESGAYIGNTLYVIPTDELHLLAILNSKVVHFFYSQISSQVRGGYLRFIAQYIGQIPIPLIDSQMQTTLEIIVNQILAAKAADPTADVTPLERQIDQLVYQLYGLTPAEIALVEGSA